MKKLTMIFLILCSTVFAQDFERNTLIEIFTNSHCPLCPSAHYSIDAYLMNSDNADRVRYIYYHMVYPYSDDELYQESSTYSAARDQYYGPYGSTPKAFFDGESQSNSYSSWDDKIDAKVAVNTPVKLELNGSREGASVTISADVTMNSSNISENDLVIQYVVVEDVYFDGRNGIDNHKNVMRAMYPTANGKPIIVANNLTVNETFELSGDWITDNITFVVFIQSTGSKDVYQSDWIDYIDLTVTDVADESINPNEFNLYQNYPNPFNPTTTIKYSIPSDVKRETSNVKLIVYDVLGTEIATLVNETKAPGTYEVVFDAASLPSGIYFYKLQYGGFTATKKLTLIK